MCSLEHLSSSHNGWPDLLKHQPLGSFLTVFPIFSRMSSPIFVEVYSNLDIYTGMLNFFNSWDVPFPSIMFSKKESVHFNFLILPVPRYVLQPANRSSSRASHTPLATRIFLGSPVSSSPRKSPLPSTLTSTHTQQTKSRFYRVKNKVL